MRCERGSVGVVWPACAPEVTASSRREDGMRRCIGLDVHREFAQVAIWEAGVVRQAGRIQTTPVALRRQIARRAHVVRQRTRLKNQVQSILHRNLVGRCPAADLFGHKGRAWLAAQDLPQDEHQAVTALLRQLDFHGQELRIVDAELGRVALERDEVRRLLTIPGVDATVALAIVAAVGDFGRFSSPQRLVSYLGLNPRVRQSGGHPAQHGRITKQGRAHARGMLVEAAWAAAKTPGPLRAFSQRVRARRGMQIAVVANARKLVTLCWHLVVKGEDYAFARPSLTDKKLRSLELRAGLPSRRGQKGTAAAYSRKEVRRRERALAEQAELAYRQLVGNWQPKPPPTQPTRKGVGVAAATGARRSSPQGGKAARQGSQPHDPALRSGVDHAQHRA